MNKDSKNKMKQDLKTTKKNIYWTSARFCQALKGITLDFIMVVETFFFRVLCSYTNPAHWITSLHTARWRWGVWVCCWVLLEHSVREKGSKQSQYI